MSTEERTIDRRALQLHVGLSGRRLEETTADLCDVSQLGCRVRLRNRVGVGTYLGIAVPGFTSIEGWVAWRKGDEAGIDFAHPLPDAVVEHLIKLGSS